ncbi:MAG: hypothetical protein ACHQQQ_06120 [Bacteroidota bacterium]
MTRSKYSERRCNHCNKVTKMEAVGSAQVGQEKMWFRCTRCRHMSLMSAVPDGETNGNGADMQNATPYTPDRSFRVGEFIFHAEWNDFGKVLSKAHTSDGSQAIVVNFEKQGQRTLIESLTTVIE